jgi:hypothetical protein
MGRPRKRAAVKQSAKVMLHLTSAERRKLAARARQLGLPVATAVRLLALLGADTAPEASVLALLAGTARAAKDLG